jgi:hypothetical protein
VAVLKAPLPAEQPVTALVSRLGNDVTRIVRAEIALVQLRLTVALRSLRAAGAGLIATALLGTAGFGALIGGIVLLIGFWIPLWISALAVGGVLVLVAAVVGIVQTRRLSANLREALTPIQAGHGE